MLLQRGYSVMTDAQMILDDNYKVLARVSSIVNRERMYSLNMNAFKIRCIFYI